LPARVDVVLKPAEEAYVAVCAMTAGSSTAEAARTLDRIFKKCGFEEKELGVGGRVGVVPMARRRVGGEVGRRVRTWWFGREGCGKW
jgi:hypothetical protein